jgi:hypothetical protein
MSGPDIPRQIAGLIDDTEDIAEAYDSIKYLRGLPEAFQEVSKHLPLIEKILRDTKISAKRLKPTDDATVLEAVLNSYDERVYKLLEIFKRIAKKSTDQYDSSVYREIAIKQGKQRVETVMDGILDDLSTLVAHSLFPTEIQRQVDALAKAREELVKVPPSLANSDLNERAGAANQYGNNNQQYNNPGNGNLKKVDGNNYEAYRDINIGMIPPKKPAERKAA